MVLGARTETYVVQTKVENKVRLQVKRARLILQACGERYTYNRIRKQLHISEIL
jgi:hypothetical protein